MVDGVKSYEDLLDGGNNKEEARRDLIENDM